MTRNIGFGLAALLGLLMLGTQASAQECQDNSGCPKGFTCEVTGASSCGGGAATPPAPSCKPGTDCGAVDAAVPACDPQEYKSCVPGPCKADSDCADGMICYTATTSVCTGGAPVCTQENCPAPAKETCTDETKSACIPRYFAPCKQAADCGEGFDCVLDQEQCACAGSSGSSGSGTPSDPGAGAKALPFAPQDAGSADRAAPTDAGLPPDDCGCTPATTMSCKAKKIACDDATQCPKDWTCEQHDSSVHCGVAVPTPGTDAGAAVDCLVPNTTPNSECTPPFSNLFGGGIAEDSNSTGGGTSGTAKGGSDDGSAAPTVAHSTDDTASTPKKSSTCSVSRVGGGIDPTGHGALLFGALGMLLTLARARRRSARTTR